MIRNTRHLTVAALLAGASVSALAAPAFAQDAAAAAPPQDANAVEDVIVTATRRSERLQDVPIAVSAVGEETIQTRKIDNFAEVVKIAPGPTFVPVKGTSVITVQIRGQGTINDSPGLENPTGVYIDDIYYSTLASFDANMFDVSQISVLRGPQGTTFGRNAVGGALQITNNIPEMGVFSGRVSATVSDYSGGESGLEADGYVNLPLGEHWAGRLAASVKDVGGYQQNLVTGNYLADNQVGAVRGSLRFQPNDRLDVVASASWLDRDGYGEGPTIIGEGAVAAGVRAATGGNLHKTLLDDEGSVDRQIFAGLVNATYDAGFGAFTSVTGYRWLEAIFFDDADGGPNAMSHPSFNSNDEWQFSQEFRFASAFEGPFNFIAGLYAGYEDLNHKIAFGFDGTNPDLFFSVLNGGLYTPGQVFEGQIENRSVGPFVEGTYELTDQLSFTAGIRYSYERKSGFTAHYGSSPFQGGSYFQELPGPDGKDSWDGWTPRFILKWEPAPNTMLYASASSGFQGGGWTFNVRTPLAARTPLEAQTTWSYEIGAKTDLFDRFATVNIAAFLADTEDLQVRAQVNGVFQDSNAGELRAQGVEVESVIRPMDGMTVGLNYAYTDAYYATFTGCTAGGLDCTGNPAPFTPLHDLTALIDYSYGFASGASLDFHFDTKFASSYELTATRGGQKAAPFTEKENIASASLQYTAASGMWDLRLWGRNLFDKEYVTNGLQYNFYHVSRAEVAAAGGLGFLDTERVTVAPPRQIGLTYTLRFGG